MPVPAPEDRILNPGVRENLLQPYLRVGHPVQVDVTLQVRILFCRSARAACDAGSETQDRQLFDPARCTNWLVPVVYVVVFGENPRAGWIAPSRCRPTWADPIPCRRLGSS